MRYNKRMFDTLHDDLAKRGWQPGTYRGFLRQVRGGFEWQVGFGRSGNLELRWVYKEQSGEEVLPENAGRTVLEDLMTGIYLRVHDKPDVTRVFGGGKRGAKSGTAPVPASANPATPEDAGQGAMDF